MSLHINSTSLESKRAKTVCVHHETSSLEYSLCANRFLREVAVFVGGGVLETAFVGNGVPRVFDLHRVLGVLQQSIVIDDWQLKR